MSALRWLLAVDQALLVRICRRPTPWLTGLMRAVTHLGDAASWTLVAAVLMAAGRPEAGWAVAGSAALATVLSQSVKRISRRARPDQHMAGFQALAQNPDAFSFPSGHTTAAVAVAISLAGEPHLGPLALGLAGAIAVSRVYLGAHYPLDVTAGALLGVGAGAVFRWGLGI